MSKLPSHRASVSPRWDSVGALGVRLGQGLHPWSELASRKDVLLDHLLSLCLLLISLNNCPVLIIPEKASPLGTHAAPLYPLPQLGFCLWRKTQLPSNSCPAVQAPV